MEGKGTHISTHIQINLHKELNSNHLKDNLQNKNLKFNSEVNFLEQKSPEIYKNKGKSRNDLMTQKILYWHILLLFIYKKYTKTVD